jgi:hypothetical protein
MSSAAAQTTAKLEAKALTIAVAISLRMRVKGVVVFMAVVS